MLTLFSWGYHGWGNHTPQLVHAVDRVEAHRGFDPPRFVDTRIRRSVRARGFQGNAFGELLGARRYRWMQDLGNESILTREPTIHLRDPSRVIDLLADAADCSARRVIFFCGCQWPQTDQGVRCHRTEIATCLLHHARTEHLPIEIIEWPGGQPTLLERSLTSEDYRAIRAGRASLPLGKTCPTVEWLGLPWGSVVRLPGAKAPLAYLAGPARYHADSWILPLLSPLEADLSDEAALGEARRFRQVWGLESHTSTA